MMVRINGCQNLEAISVICKYNFYRVFQFKHYFTMPTPNMEVLLQKE